jgi:peptidoglycan hydrolase-like protein with peptidoglycan-binding domain
MLPALVTRTLVGLDTLNTLVIPTFPVLFQFAPGRQSGVGISGATFLIFAAGQQIGGGTTNDKGEVPLPIAPLFFSPPVVVRIFDTDYNITIGPSDVSETLPGWQKRLEVLGYMSGYQRNPIGSDRADDNDNGPRTQQATLNFQTDQTLEVDGDIGPKTSDALRKEAGL